MKKLGEFTQTAEWKTEKHVPVIECPDAVQAGQKFQVTVSVGKEIPHPNTTEHHIVWIDLYFQPEGEKFTHHLGHYEFLAHGASVQGPNQGPAYAEPVVCGTHSLKRSGTFFAVEWCNIHGLWESSRDIQVG